MVIHLAAPHLPVRLEDDDPANKKILPKVKPWAGLTVLGPLRYKPREGFSLVRHFPKMSFSMAPMRL